MNSAESSSEWAWLEGFLTTDRPKFLLPDLPPDAPKPPRAGECVNLMMCYKRGEILSKDFMFSA